MEDQDLIYETKRSLVISFSLIFIFITFYLVARTRYKLDKIVFIVFSSCVTLPYVLVAYGNCNELYLSETNYHLLHKTLPPELQISKVLFKDRRHYGMGPGGIYEGLYKLEISPEIANKIDITYLRTSSYYHDVFSGESWNATPYAGKKIDFHNFFHFVHANEDIIKDINHSLKNEGSYYIQRDDDEPILLVSPKKGVAYYFYN